MFGYIANSTSVQIKYFTVLNYLEISIKCYGNKLLWSHSRKVQMSLKSVKIE